MTERAETPLPQRLLRQSGHVTPQQARSFICLPFRVPPHTGELRIRFSFEPARAQGYRNLLTLGLFGPTGFRGAAHRHAPEQQIEVGPLRATPGFLPGQIGSGAWLLEIDCHAVLQSDRGGVEYEVEVAGLPAALAAPLPGPGSAEAVEALPGHLRSASAAAAAEAERRWLKADLHVHSDHSDGRWTVGDLARYVAANNLDVLAVTDHNTTSALDTMQEAVRAAGVAVVLVPGMELTTFYGHANALGVTRWIDWRVRGPEGWPPTIGSGPHAPPTRTMEVAAAEVHRLGGTFVINHPRSGGYPGCTGCRWELGDDSARYADAVEVWNGPWARDQNVEALRLWNRWLSSGRRISATAGTDSHLDPQRPHALGFTHIWAPPDVPGILQAVRAGQTYLSCGPALAWQHPLPGERYRPSDGPLIADVDHLTEAADLWLIGQGELLARQSCERGGRVRFELGPAAASAAASWYRLELYRRGTTDLLAMTNPLYAE